MMVVVVVTFALCWLPYHIYFILGSFNRDIYKQHYIQQVSSMPAWYSFPSGLFMHWMSCFFFLTGVSGHFLVGHEFDHVQPYHLLLSKPKVKGTFTPREFHYPKTRGQKPTLLSFCRFRAGFRHAFAWCPFIKVSEEDKMELQHTHTFRVTMTRSHRRDSAYARTSTKTNNAFDTNLAVSTELNTERDASKTYSARTVKRSDGTISSAAKLMQHSH